MKKVRKKRVGRRPDYGPDRGESPDAYYMMDGQFPIEEGRYRSRMDTNRIEEIPSDASPTAYIRMGNVAFNLEEYPKAVLLYSRAIEKDPLMERAWNNKGVALKNLGLHEEALRCFENAIKINPLYESAWLNRAASLQSIGKEEETLDALDEVLIINPFNIPALYHRGQVLEDSSRTPEALDNYLSILRLDPENKRARIKRDEIIHQLKHGPPEVDAFESLNWMNLQPDYPVPERLMKALASALRVGRHPVIRGPPGSGKTALAREMIEMVCWKDYTQIRADPSWGREDGTLQSLLVDTARCCRESLESNGRPHFLLIHGWEDMSRDSVEVISSFFKQDNFPSGSDMLSETIPLPIPANFRVLGIWDRTDDGRLPAERLIAGSLVLLDMPAATDDDEARCVPRLVRRILEDQGNLPISRDVTGSDDEKDGDHGEVPGFDYYDVNGEILDCYASLCDFLRAEQPDPTGRSARGVRSYLSFGPAFLADVMAFVVSSADGYAKKEALEDSIAMEIVPMLRDLDIPSLRSILDKSNEVFGEGSAVSLALEGFLD